MTCNYLAHILAATLIILSNTTNSGSSPIGGNPSRQASSLPQPSTERRITVSSSYGKIVSIDSEKNILTLQDPSAATLKFRLDARDTLIYDGLRSLSLDELQKGMRVEIDYRDTGVDVPPLAIWVELLPDKSGDS